jgi:DnaJ-class molecular chaperone
MDRVFEYLNRGMERDQSLFDDTPLYMCDSCNGSGLDVRFEGVTCEVCNGEGAC